MRFDDLSDDALLRVNDFLKRPQSTTWLLPFSRSHWFDLVAEGKAPAPVARMPRATLWRLGDIRRYVADLAGGE